MTVDMFLRALRGRARVVLMCALVGVLAAVGVMLVAPKTFTSTSELVVEVDPDADTTSFDPSATIVGQVPTYLEVARSASTVDAIGEELGGGAPDELESRLSYEVPEGTSVIEISGVGNSPEEAKAIADAAATVLTGLLAQDEFGAPGLAVQPLQEGTSPVSPASPDPLVVLPLGLALGLLVGVLAALVLTIRDPYARSLGDIRDAVQAPVLGLLPQSSNRKTREEAAKDHLPTSFAGLFARLGTYGKSRAARLLTVASVDPDVSATWLAWGIVRTASASGLRCAVIATRSAPLHDWNRARHLDSDDDRAVRVVDVGRSGFDGVLTPEALDREVRSLLPTFDLVVFVAENLADDPDNRAYLEASARVLLACGPRPTKGSLATARDLAHAGDAQVAGVVMVDPEAVDPHPGSTSRRYNNVERSQESHARRRSLPSPTEPVPMVPGRPSHIPHSSSTDTRERTKE